MFIVFLHSSCLLLTFCLLWKVDARCTLGNLMKAQGLVQEVRIIAKARVLTCDFYFYCVNNKVTAHE